MEGFLFAMDIEKGFDSLDHIFLTSVLKKFGFGEYFIGWIETFKLNQESCVIDSGKKNQHFKLQRRVRQGDRIFAYLFILALEFLLYFIKNDKLIEGLEICDRHFLHSAYTDGTTLF